MEALDSLIIKIKLKMNYQIALEVVVCDLPIFCDIGGYLHILRAVVGATVKHLGVCETGEAAIARGENHAADDVTEDGVALEEEEEDTKELCEDSFRPGALQQGESIGRLGEVGAFG